MSIRIPVLTYHALHAPGWGYSSNDHVALAEDLQCIRALGFQVVRLAEIADRVAAGTLDQWHGQKLVGISMDDGTDHDWHDFQHPGWGHLRSMANVLRDHGADLGKGNTQANATSFVITSPDARSVLDQTCIAGRGQWQDSWWLDAARSGVLDIGNHSWDHVHPNLEQVAQQDNLRGNFTHIDNLLDATRQIANAEDYLDRCIGDLNTRLFAYPYGQYNEYLVADYLPRQTRVKAAFTGDGRYVDSTSGRWTLPRFICQEHWKTSADLRSILLSSID